MRKIGMPIEDIREVLKETVDLKSAVQKQMIQLRQEKLDLEVALALCKELEPQTIQNMDTDLYLKHIEQEERKENKFFDIIEDYQKIAKSEGEKSFCFSPDDLVESPHEFTDALIKYANSNHYDITITKESMHPEFELNGIEYTAYRAHHRFGPIIYCEAVHPEELEPSEMSSGRKRYLKIIRWIIPYVLIFGTIYLFTGYTAVLFTGVLFMILTTNWVKVYDIVRNKESRCLSRTGK